MKMNFFILHCTITFIQYCGNELDNRKCLSFKKRKCTAYQNISILWPSTPNFFGAIVKLHKICKLIIICSIFLYTFYSLSHVTVSSHFLWILKIIPVQIPDKLKQGENYNFVIHNLILHNFYLEKLTWKKTN